MKDNYACGAVHLLTPVGAHRAHHHRHLMQQVGDVSAVSLLPPDCPPTSLGCVLEDPGEAPLWTLAALLGPCFLPSLHGSYNHCFHTSWGSGRQTNSSTSLSLAEWEARRERQAKEKTVGIEPHRRVQSGLSQEDLNVLRDLLSCNGL